VTALLVFAGGMAGAPSRYLLDRYIQARHSHRFPIGTLSINVLGCLLLGVIAGAVGTPTWVVALLGTGFCGGFTTFSTFTVESVELALQGQLRGALKAGAYVGLSLVLGLGAAAAGSVLA
jgi:CrcB protein